eukprot:3497625-Rhodomonas_salina.1
MERLLRHPGSLRLDLVAAFAAGGCRSVSVGPRRAPRPRFAHTFKQNKNNPLLRLPIPAPPCHSRISAVGMGRLSRKSKCRPLKELQISAGPETWEQLSVVVCHPEQLPVSVSLVEVPFV